MSQRVIETGIHTDISIDEYHAEREHVSATQIKIAKRSLKEYHWFCTGKIAQEDKPHFSFGNAFELALFDKSEFDKSVAIEKDADWIKAAQDDKAEKGEKALISPRGSAKYKGLKSQWESENEGKYIIPETGKESFETIQAMLESCYRDEMVQRLIKNTEYQLSLFWDDPVTGLRLKTRPDICQRKKNIVVNVKTALDGSPAAFSKDLAKHDYPIQACIEILGCLNTGLMEQVDNYFWLVVEKLPPYNATIYEFAKGDIDLIMDEVMEIFARLKRAETQNLFPGYSEKADNKYGILKAQIPLWYKSAFNLNTP